VFFSTINRNAKAFLFAIVGAEHVLKLLPKGTHEYAASSARASWRSGAATPGWRSQHTRAWNTTR
jgi:2-polyprenyl-6-hydroxyphenyl methylase/3-demethylubiquinone-9 3-methyltransferase